SSFFFLSFARPPSLPLFPYTTLFRSRVRNIDTRFGNFSSWVRATRNILPVPRLGRALGTPSSAYGARAKAGGGQASFPSPKPGRSEEHTSELQSLTNLVCRLLLEKKK